MTDSVAHVSWLGGMAYIETPQGIYLLEAEEDGPKDGTGCHYGMYLQPGMTRIERCDAGEYPFTELHEKMKFQFELHELFSLFRMLLQPHQKDLHQSSLDFLEDGLRSEKVWEGFKEFVLQYDPGEAASFDHLPKTGRVGELVVLIKEKYPH